MKIPRILIVKEAGYWLDGGTISLRVREPFSFLPDFLGRRLAYGTKHEIVLAQHMWRPVNPADCSSERIPGRLYFDNELIPIKSASEMAIIAAFRQGHPAPKVSDSG